MSCFVTLQRRCSFRNLQQTRRQLQRARRLLSTQKREDTEMALLSLESALKICPRWEKALELKARALLHLKRFEQVAEMFYEFIPSLMSRSMPLESPVLKEKTSLLSDYLSEEELEFRLPYFISSSVAKFRNNLSRRLYKTFEKGQWMYVVLGQACCHLGMMEDAMILLQNGKRSASAASRRQSNCTCDDKFSSDNLTVAEAELVNQMLGNIKFLLRRRTAALAALEAGLYSESVRCFSKIVEGRKGAPQGFVAECYLHRAIAYQAIGKVADAIADCNKTLALNPNCTRALSVRASLYEMVKCFSECLLDLQQLKMIYEAALRYRVLREPRWMIRYQNVADVDFAGGLDYINSKMTTTRHRLTNCRSIDAHTILDLPRNCSMAEVEKAYLLISLKHSPEKAANFVDFCDLVDRRNTGDIKEEARASALRLSRLIYKAYTWLLSSIVAEETRKQKDQRMTGPDKSTHKYESPRQPSHEGVQVYRRHAFLDRKVTEGAERTDAMDMPPLQDEDGWFDAGEPYSFGLIEFGSNRTDQLGNIFSSTSLADVGAMISDALGPESSSEWIRSPDWSYTTAQTLPVT